MIMTKIDLDSYHNFVSAVTSETSNQTDTLVNRLQHLATHENLNPSLLLTASIGLSSEGGEFSEIVKKMIFQGKPFNEEQRFHMKRELGDIAWYWTNACRALGYSPNDVIAENVKKLESRYPGGSFDPFYSENRAEGDL
jgi:NTP pyrophosphatase (non-canonical NTP hydrolase)